MLSLFLATFSFFASIYFVRRYLDGAGIEKGFVRGALVFTIALAIACAVGFGVGMLETDHGVEIRK